jgi:hypothetical protein
LIAVTDSNGGSTAAVELRKLNTAAKPYRLVPVGYDPFAEASLDAPSNVFAGGEGPPADDAMSFDIQGARRAGYTDSEIADYLARELAKAHRFDVASAFGYMGAGGVAGVALTVGILWLVRRRRMLASFQGEPPDAEGAERGLSRRVWSRLADLPWQMIPWSSISIVLLVAVGTPCIAKAYSDGFRYQSTSSSIFASLGAACLVTAGLLRFRRPL